jgi:uncharacterized membrane protein
MNIHPLLVHFPIALLSVYAVLEIIKYRNFQVKSVLLYLGTLSSYVTVAAGFMAKRLISNEEVLEIVNKHQTFGITTSVIFTIISIFYLLKKEAKIIVVLAILGLISIFITGALGGSIVYGPSNDPVTEWIYNLIMSNFSN